MASSQGTGRAAIVNFSLLQNFFLSGSILAKIRNIGLKIPDFAGI